MENLQQQVAGALGITEEQTTETPTEETTTTATETPVPEAQNTATTEKTTDEAESTDSKGNTTIRQMRDEISNSKKENQRLNNLLKRLADEKGVPVEKLEEELQVKEDKRAAETMNVTPEVAAQIRQQNERIKQLEQENARIEFNSRVDSFIKNTGLSQQDTVQFLQDAQARGFNPLNKGMDLNVLYRAMNFDALSKAKEASIRQDILNEMQRQKESGNAIPGVVTTPTQNTSDLSDEDFMSQLRKSLK